jgi:hypothetical protein
VAGAAHNGGEDGAGGIVTSETGLAHTGTVVDNEGLYFFFFVRLGGKRKREEKEEKNESLSVVGEGMVEGMK